jgi:hypothetical protein
MANDGRSHAWLSRLSAEAGGPFLPKVGELYLVKTIIYSACDPAADRPVVVVFVPPASVPHSTIRIFTRTSKDVAGIKHPADLGLGCERDGVFSNFESVEQQLWIPQNVKRLGVLGEPYLARVLERAE